MGIPTAFIKFGLIKSAIQVLVRIINI